MFAKLIDDSIRTCVKKYKIDAFRWDLMGHHPLAQIEQTLAAANKSILMFTSTAKVGTLAKWRMIANSNRRANPIWPERALARFPIVCVMPCAVAAHLMAKRAYALTKAGVTVFMCKKMI